MKLPTINTPTFDIKIPSLGKDVKFRPFLIKEEKLLLIALESSKDAKTSLEGAKGISDAVINVISNCIMDKEINVRELANFDVEYIFLKLRAKSVSEISEIAYINKECDNDKEKNEDGECIQKISVNISEIELETDPSNTKKIMITEDLGVIMKYPTNDTFFNVKNGVDDITSSFNLISSCMEQIFDKENVYMIKEYTQDQIREFLENLSGPQIEKILVFFNTLPKLKKTINNPCKKCGKVINIELEGIQDFFG